MNLKAKNVLITGGARRIGREIALELARRGANILIHYRESKNEAATLCRKLRSLKVRSEILAFDFSGHKHLDLAIHRFWKDVEKKIGPVDILVNNASVFYPAPLGKVKERHWDELMNINLKVPFFLSQEAARGMRRRGRGKIIHLVDWALERPRLHYAPYTAAKAGLVSLTLSQAVELAPSIQVNAVAPGPILPVEGAGKAQNAKAARQTLLKRFGSPADIAAAISFLVRNDYMTGVILPVDGGASLA